MNDLFLRACLNKPVERTPIWIMRQAGRYMAEYRAVRKEHDFWTVCRTPELATQVTMQPIDSFGLDAAILFSDILTVLPPMGCQVAFNPGPEVANPIRTRSDIDNLKVPSPTGDLGFVMDAIRSVKGELAGRVPLIGFGGAPLTLAAYMIEGGGSKNFLHLKSLLYDDPVAAHKLMDFLVESQAAYLNAQIDAGAQAIQIFDTWAGNMSRTIFKEFILNPVTALIEKIKRPGVPIIYFMRDSAHVLDLLSSTGADVLSLDDKLPLDEAAKVIGPGPALQGNMDSALMLGSKEGIRKGAGEVLKAAPEGRGHIFNLGHGILPPTPVENVEHLVRCVAELSGGGRA